MQNDLIKIEKLYLQKNYPQAERVARKILEQHPHKFISYKVLGSVLSVQRKIAEGIEMLLHADSIESYDFDVNNNLSYLYLQTHNIEPSINYAKKAIEIDGTKSQPYLNLARCKMIQRDYLAAEKYALKSIELCGGKIQAAKSGFNDVFDTLLDSLLAQNRSQECIELCIELLDEVHFFSCLNTLIDLDFASLKDIYIQRVRDYLASSNNQSTVSNFLQYKSVSHFILANYHSKLKERETSEEHYIKGNEFALEWQRFMPMARQKRFQRTIDFFTNQEEKLKKLEIPKNKGENIIFILGMPRSGTTLTESIVATNSNVFAGGELAFFEHEIKKEEVSRKIESQSLDIDFFLNLGDKYLAQTNFIKNDKEYITDKMPDNYRFLGYIKIALPGAKFIHISRNPWDNAISLFKQIYLANILYSTSFFNIGLEYANHLCIMAFWNKFFGNDVCLSLKYEQLVQNYEKTTDEIWKFCAFKDSLDLKSRANFYARTASKTQVRGEVHQRSLKKTEFIEKKEIFEEALNNQLDHWKRKYQIFNI